MSTRSSIAMKVAEVDGLTGFKEVKCVGVYCHFDGYLSGVGKTLLNHYDTLQKVRELIALGDMSILGSTPFPNPEAEHSFDGERQEGVCLYYHRDRGEAWEHTQPGRYENEQELFERLGQEYNYLWQDGRWYYAEQGWDEQLGRYAYTDYKPLTQEAIDAEG